jgi:xanthine dehydrogenase accessory factor
LRNLSELIVLVRGGGEAGSAVAHRLHRCHFRVCITELASPLAIHRGTCFSEAVYDTTKTVEGVTAERTPPSLRQIYRIWQNGNIPVVVDPELSVKPLIRPDVLVNAMMLKRVTSTWITDAPLVIGIGAGFQAGEDVHLVVESSNSPNLGRVIEKGGSEEDTGIPPEVGGVGKERVIWAPDAGVFTTKKSIGDSVTADEVVGKLGDLPLKTTISGIVRGILRNETRVSANAKLAEIDPVNDGSICFTIRDKMRAIAGGVLEAIMLGLNVGK